MDSNFIENQVGFCRGRNTVQGVDAVRSLAVEATRKRRFAVLIM